MSILETILEASLQKKAARIHIISGNQPAARINGDVVKLELPEVTTRDAEEIACTLFGEESYREFLQCGDMDGVIQLPGFGRFRINAFKLQEGAGIVLTVIDSKIRTMEELGLPDSLHKILEMKNGLVLVTGPVGSGKSTTLASIIDAFNRTRKLSILTIEDPVEFLHTPDRCIISQRQLGLHTNSFHTALRAALREDPDIILVGEMRDNESIQAAVTAAETGHLVLSTLHTPGAAKTLDRIIDSFPPEQQQQIRVQLSQTLKAVISQRLIKKEDGSGRVGAFEVMFQTPAVSNLIREGKTANIRQVIQTGKNDGMQTMEMALERLINSGIISKQELLAGEDGIA